MAEPVEPVHGSEKLLSPLKMGALALAHRIVMPAMPRRRAAPPLGVPTPSMVRYYAQRATPGGLIICETASVVSDVDEGRSPGLYSAEQVNHWRHVTDAVHAQGGLVLAQLGHGRLPYPLGADDVDGALEHYRNAAENASDAGFDGVELRAVGAEASSGFCLDFLQEITQTLISVWGASRVGVCVAPFHVSQTHTECTQARQTLSVDAAASLGRSQIAYLHLMRPPLMGIGHAEPRLHGEATLELLRAVFGGVMMVGGDQSVAEAQALVNADLADAAAFALPFIANPDLVHRVRVGLPLADVVRLGLFEGGDQGYIDYPVWGARDSNACD